MKLSIIIPTYNRSSFIIKTALSALEQTYSDFEVIIVDDGSTDNTEAVIKSISNSKLFYYKKTNAERGSARNFGTYKATGEYVTYLDSDDIVYPNHLQTASEIIQEKNNPEVFHLGYEIKTPEDKRIKRIDHLPPTANNFLIKGNTLSCNGVFIRRDIALNNLFSENRILSALEDWELWLRLAAQFPFYTDNRVTSAIINHDERSVLLTEKENLLKRFDALFTSILSNKDILAYYKGKIKLFKSSCYTYIALHLALTKKYKIESINYLLKGLKENPKTIFTRRFFAILKHLLS